MTLAILTIASFAATITAGELGASRGAFYALFIATAALFWAAVIAWVVS